MLTRRQMLVGAGATVAASGAGIYLLRRDSKPVPGSIVGAPAQLGHRIRNNDWPAPSAERSVEVVVVGAGIAGLSAARELKRHGVRDLLVLEAAGQPGGNSLSGENAISAYPWGAHYVPLMRNDDDALLTLGKEMGIIVGFQDDLPIYNEYFLSADPQERLLKYGRWQEGLVPMLGTSPDDKAQYQRFFTQMNQLKSTRGADGKPAFCIPVAHSSTDSQWRALDKITMSEYLTREQYTSSSLRWYVDYCCRDDYGAPADRISAWAGVHYFAARNGRAANADATTMITWPEGNGFFARAWSHELGKCIELNSLAVDVVPLNDGVTIDYFNGQTNRTTRIRARAAVLALPAFVMQRVLRRNNKGLNTTNDTTKTAPGGAVEYSPWMVANLTLSARPRGEGTELAWDNVAYDSAMLGYVVANFQTLSRPPPETVITYYWPLCHTDSTSARREALARSHYDWQVLIESDLYRIHPELKGHVQHMDVMVWGHGMIRPTPNTIWSDARTHSDKVSPPIFLAHSDLSGISIFEEAFHRGINAARECHQHLAQYSGAIA